MTKNAYVYILASKKHGTLYTGVTTNLIRRIYEHKHHLQQGFTRKYNVTRLVWYEQGEDISAAIALEKKIKNRNRQWKIDLIERDNPNCRCDGRHLRLHPHQSEGCQFLGRISRRGEPHSAGAGSWRQHLGRSVSLQHVRE